MGCLKPTVESRAIACYYHFDVMSQCLYKACKQTLFHWYKLSLASRAHFEILHDYNRGLIQLATPEPIKHLLCGLPAPTVLV